MTLVDVMPQSQASRPAAPWRSRTDAWDTPSWVDTTGVVRARLSMILGIPVVRAVAELDRHALRPIRQALDQAHGTSPTGVVLDLSGTRQATAITIALLGCMRRYLHTRSSELVLVGAPAGLPAAMDRAHVLSLFVVAATPAEAVAVVRTRVDRHAATVNTPPRAGGQPRRSRSLRPGCCVGCLDCA